MEFLERNKIILKLSEAKKKNVPLPYSEKLTTLENTKHSKQNAACKLISTQDKRNSPRFFVYIFSMCYDFI